MYNLKKIDLGNDEAEQDENLAKYFLRTESYKKCLTGKKTLIIGRKGSGKSAIFKLLTTDLSKKEIVITLTPDQYSWTTLREYKEKGISQEQAHTNAWKLTLISSVIWHLSEKKIISDKSKMIKYYKYMKDSYKPGELNWFLNIAEKTKNLLNGIKTEWLSFDLSSSIGTPLKIVTEIKQLMLNEWPDKTKVRILIDRIDDCWDASEDSKYLIIGLLKAVTELNSFFESKLAATVFLRSDIYSNLFFDDQDKIREHEEYLMWDIENLKDLIAERVRYSLKIKDSTDQIWRELFSKKLYRQSAKPEKYIIDRTFKRPRDMLSFIRYAIEISAGADHACIETQDTKIAEEDKYSESKYKDLVIENQKQYPYIKNLIDSFSGKLHKITIVELKKILIGFIKKYDTSLQTDQIIRLLFTIGFIGIKRKGTAGVRQRGGEKMYYYFDDPSINPLGYTLFFIHPALRHYLNISEKREKIKKTNY